MEIADIDVTIVSIAREFGMTSAVKETDDSVFALIKLIADDGTTGVGEISDIEDAAQMPQPNEIKEELARFLIGEDPREVNRLTNEMYEAVDFGPFDFHTFQQLALAGIDTALYDLVGNHYGIPVYQLLGGHTQDIPVCWVIYTRQEPNELDAMREEVKTRYNQGFRAFKLKVGEVDPDIDAERIRAVRDIGGDDVQIFVDAQGVWELEEAIENIHLFEDIGIDGIETPVGHPDKSVQVPGYYYDIPLVPSDLATVREMTDTPVFEHVIDPSFGLALAKEDAVDVFTVEVCAGGINRAERILAIAEGAGIDARLGSTGELGPGTLAAGALGASSTAVTYPCDLAGTQIYAESVLENGLKYPNGHLSPRKSSGFGFTVQNDLFR